MNRRKFCNSSFLEGEERLRGIWGEGKLQLRLHNLPRPNYVYFIYVIRSFHLRRKKINKFPWSVEFFFPSLLPPPCFSMHRLINRGEKEIAIMHVRMRRNGGHASYNISERRERASLPSGQEKQVVSKWERRIDKKFHGKIEVASRLMGLGEKRRSNAILILFFNDCRTNRLSESSKCRVNGNVSI